jgi:hypothetical protein
MRVPGITANTEIDNPTNALKSNIDTINKELEREIQA